MYDVRVILNTTIEESFEDNFCHKFHEFLLLLINCELLDLWISGLAPSHVEQSNDISASRSEHGDGDDDTLDEMSKAEPVPLLTPDHLGKLYVFALIWAMGAFLETEDRLKYDVFLKEQLTHLDLPKNKPKNADVSCKFVDLHFMVSASKYTTNN